MPSLQLVQDVVNAPEAELRAVVRAFCVADRQVYGRLSDYLENLQQARLPVTGRKRKRNISDFRVCYRCEKAFFESENTEGVCQYHPGLFSVNRDYWSHREMHPHEPINTPENREETPQGFIWDCCERVNGRSEGCKRGKHWSRDKRPRSDSDDDEDVEDGEEEDED